MEKLKKLKFQSLICLCDEKSMYNTLILVHVIFYLYHYATQPYIERPMYKPKYVASN